MGHHLHNIGTLSIPNGQTASNAYAVPSALGELVSLVIFSPATLPEATTVQVAPFVAPAAGDWKTLQLTGTGAATDVAVAANKAVNLSLVAGYRAIRLLAAAVAAQRDFVLVAQISDEVAY